MIDTSAYMVRISQASPAGLVVINFELILDFLNEALESAGEREIFRQHLQKAKEGIEQLIQSLDFEVPVSQTFYDIYSYCYKLLCDVQFSTDSEAACSAVKEVQEYMEKLLEGWRETAEKSNLEPTAEATEDTPKVYTGLTYGRDGQANEYIDENKDRGYMA
ncbi:MAG: flagellar protein FliS [Defluviitaleaceae bacterium]|nr:flagellar protein FliS [Defluviitaleaceae bacterium]